MAHPMDGSLPSWDDVSEEHSWRALLVGNGLSAHLWRPFDYGSLFRQACEIDALSEDDQALFQALASENFESALAALSTSMRTLDALGYDTDFLLDRYLSVQEALGEAIRSVHVELSEVDKESLAAIRQELLRHRWVFTTSYDLLLYWAAGHGETFDGFVDYFWSHGRNEFDTGNTRVVGGDDPTRLLFLHGALHLVVDSDGVTRKRTRGLLTLLEQFAMPLRDDRTARPLLITEGDSADKQRAIANNGYLSFALRRLRGCKRPLVVFGHRLSEQDAHLLEALNARPERPVAVGLRDHGRMAVRRRQREVGRALDTEELYFYDSATHPLGIAELSGG
jgi:hypothetical protein